jgi:AraC-like DNA-binding protein
VIRHLRKYLMMLLAPDGLEDEPRLIEHVRTTLVDLVALAIGARGDAAEAARGRGLRSARVRQIVAEIRKGFADPAFSTTEAAHALGMSPRYLQHLLHETGATFTEHVNELRLRKAHKMLASPLHDALKIKDIAHACGFSEVPYFNRIFRRRFGLSPSDCRNPRAATGSDKS